jgi:cytidylate kinase
MTEDAREPRTGSRPVVTIFETYGSGAASIGPRLAEALGVPFVAQALSSEDLEIADTAPALEDNLLTRILRTLGRGAVAADGGVFSGPQHQRATAERIAAVRNACADGAVVVGRNATVILSDLPHALHVKLDGPVEQRVARGAAEAGIDLAHARSRQVREDRVRAEMSVRIHNWDPRHNDRFDLVVNTGTLADDAAVELIVAAHRIKATLAR